MYLRDAEAVLSCLQVREKALQLQALHAESAPKGDYIEYVKYSALHPKLGFWDVLVLERWFELTFYGLMFCTDKA